LYNGTNADDLQDATRVGLLAAGNFDVKSPLQHSSKLQVRRAALHLGLPNWNAAAAPCLRSRLALGVQATGAHLEMIEQAERYVRNSLKVDETANIRVRMLTNQRAMIEVDYDLLKFITLGKQQQTFFRNLGFSSVSARPFRTGSVARRESEESMAAAVG
jgi:PP-loop superfamily ATP-utilizing enzyme